WLMDLPPAIDQLFWQDLKTYQEERTVPFITTPERYGIRTGTLQMIEDLVRVRFGEEGVKLMTEIKPLEDADKYRTIHLAIAGASTLDEVRRACSEAAAPPPTPKEESAQARRVLTDLPEAASRRALSGITPHHALSEGVRRHSLLST